MSSLLAATRPTRRDMARHPLRLLAAILLVALPVALFSVNLVWAWSNQSALRIAEPRTVAWYSGGQCIQSPDATQAHCSGAEEPPGFSEQEHLAAALPEGFTAQLRLNRLSEVSAGPAVDSVHVRQLSADALPRNLDPETGSLPGPGEIMLPKSTAARLGVDAGDEVELDTGERAGRSLQVSGVMPGYAALTVEPTLADPAAYRSVDGFGASDSGWMITGPDAFTWEDVLALNEAGFLVQSQDVIDDPPPAEELAPEYRSTGTFIHDNALSTWLSVISAAAIVLIGVVLLLLLISPVFTIAVSRQSRVFALMSSQGATPRQIRWAVLAYGLFTGLIGATLGLVLGVGGTSLWWAVQNPGWPVTVPWLPVVAAWGFAVLGSVLAAFLPAVLAARAAISAGIQGATPDRMRGWRPWMAVGPVALVIIVLGWFLAGSVLGGQSDRRLLHDLEPVLLLLFLLSLAATAPVLVWGLGRITRSAPLALRLAGRNAGRQSLRSVPVVAALMALVFIALTVITTEQTNQTHTQALNASVYRPEALTVSPTFGSAGQFSEEDLAPAVELARSKVGPAESIDLYGLPFGRSSVPWIELHRVGQQHCMYDEESGTLLAPDGSDPRTDSGAAALCLPDRRHAPVSGALGGVDAQALIAGPEILSLFSGMDEGKRAAAAEALRGPAVLMRTGETSGEAEFQVREVGGEQEPVVLGSATLPVHAVLPELFPGRIVSPQAAQALGIEPVYLGTTLLPSGGLDHATQRDIRETLAEETYGVQVSYTVEHWSFPGYSVVVAGVLGLIVLVVVALALALSAPQSRRQFALLDALGADPSLASRTSAVLAGLLAGVATVTGLVAAYLASWLGATRTVTDINGAVLEVGEAGFVRVDWWIVLVLAVVTPLAAAAVGGLFHRRRGEPEYRET
ncbi:ABC transporter permease [Corynebacterium halotolerans]|uniref:ABC3 transporter permease C-terminal domain-containing protein n=1 Tax=Corynebacterium halotolerans YIM 70093 = DSM 44683 TaxID=1121362 RepID=M1P5C1_9CORY|nr:FtsX-like permease family protein [Corynebacterium halotolerans]AGF71861.1 hypothetical protein A605_04250 [Corynebacterium halotolerans YIM 70093 = DSM 44683]